MICAYCQSARAVHKDHVVPKRLRRLFPEYNELTVPSCSTCNFRKFTHTFLPESHAHLKEELEEKTHKKWRLYKGGSVEAVFKEDSNED